MVIHLFTLASTIQQRYSRTLHPIKTSSKNNSNDWVTPMSASRKKKVKFSKPTSTPETGYSTHRTSTAGKPEALAAENNPFVVLGEQAPSPPSAPPEVIGKAIQGRKYGDPAHPVGSPPLPDHQHVTIPPPSPDKEEGQVTPSYADIPDSIDRTLLDALQEKRTGNQLPATMTSLARVRSSQFRRYLATGKETAETTIQATLDLVSLGQGLSGSTTLADKVSTVSHTLDVQPSTAVPAQIDSSKRGLTPTAVAGSKGGSLYTAIANSGNICLTCDSISGYTPSQHQHQLSSFRMSANDIPEQLVLRGTSDEDVPAILTQFWKHVKLKVIYMSTQKR